MQTSNFVNSQLNTEKSFLRYLNSQIVIEMSTSNPQKARTSKYEHNSTVFNKTIAGSEIGKTDFRLQNLSSTLSLTNHPSTHFPEIKA